MEFTAVDGGVAAITVLSGILAYARGFAREALAIAGWVAASIAVFYFAPQLEPLVKEIPVVGEFLVDSCELAIIAAFAVVFAGALIVVSIFAPLFAGAVQRSALGGIDQGLGFLFGIARGLLIVAIALIIYDRAVTDQSYPMVDDSQSAQIFAQVQEQLAENIPVEIPAWIEARYEELVGSCGAPAAPVEATEAPAADAEAPAADQ